MKNIVIILPEDVLKELFNTVIETGEARFDSPDPKAPLEPQYVGHYWGPFCAWEGGDGDVTIGDRTTFCHQDRAAEIAETLTAQHRIPVEIHNCTTDAPENQN